MQEAAGGAARKDWPKVLIDEMERNYNNGKVGHKLVSETEKVRVWHIELAPGERIGFHSHVLDYFWTALGAGKSRSHYADGRTIEVTCEAGETRHLSFNTGERMQHDLENVGETPLRFVTVEFKDSSNAPLLV